MGVDAVGVGIRGAFRHAQGYGDILRIRLAIGVLVLQDQLAHKRADLGEIHRHVGTGGAACQQITHIAGGGGGHAVRCHYADVHGLCPTHVGQGNGDGGLLILAGGTVHLRRTGQNIHLLADGQHDVLGRLARHRLSGLVGQVDAQHGGAYLRVLLGHDLIGQGRCAARLDGVGIGGVRTAHAQGQAGGIGEHQTGDDLLGRVILGVVDNGQAQLRFLACHQAGDLCVVHIQLIFLHHYSHRRSVIAVDNGDLGREAALCGGTIFKISSFEFDALVAGGGKGRHGEGIVQILDLTAGPIAEILTIIGGSHYERKLVQRGGYYGSNRHTGQRTAYIDHGDTHGNGLIWRTCGHGVGAVHIGAGHLQAAEGGGHTGHIAVVNHGHIGGDLEGHILGDGGAVHGILTPHGGVDLEGRGIAALAGKLADLELEPHLRRGVVGHVL